MSDNHWADRAACRGESLDDFFGPEGERVTERHARERLVSALICRGCPVTRQCLDYAIEIDAKEGVWGGKSPEQIAGERRRRSRRKAAA